MWRDPKIFVEERKKQADDERAVEGELLVADVGKEPREVVDVGVFFAVRLVARAPVVTVVALRKVAKVLWCHKCFFRGTPSLRFCR